MKNRKSTPAGQPKALPRVRVSKSEDGKKKAHLTYPHEIVRIRNKDHLLAELEHYSHPMPWMDGSGFAAKKKASLKYIVEWTLPALRWYCRVFNVDIPDWLKGNHWLDMLTGAEKRRRLGDIEVTVSEWKEDPRFTGVRA